MFIMHGQQDTVLPFNQSIRLCNSLSGDPDSGPVSLPDLFSEIDSVNLNNSSLRQVVNCDARGSQLHLISEGEPALDLCIVEQLCLAGSPASAELVRDSIDSMLTWINERNKGLLDDQGNQSSGRGTIGLSALMLLWISAISRVPYCGLIPSVRNLPILFCQMSPLSTSAD